MIYESAPWKVELRRAADMLVRWTPKYETQRGYFILEKNTFLSAFVLRKLCDSNMVTDALRSRATIARCFPATPRVKTSVSAATGKTILDEVYDLERYEMRSLDMRKIANLIIHSFFFWIQQDENGEVCLFFTSDWKKEEFVIELPVRRFVELLRKAVKDHVRSYSITFDDMAKKPLIELR